jgi:hypothetical protein
MAEFVQKFLKFQLEDELFAEVGRDVMWVIPFTRR